ncbi:UNVERIFIED_CONTAM: hypothetical protein FKN15_040668 [Acipenser sinensis]
MHASTVGKKVQKWFLARMPSSVDPHAQRPQVSCCLSTFSPALALYCDPCVSFQVPHQMALYGQVSTLWIWLEVDTGGTLRYCAAPCCVPTFRDDKQQHTAAQGELRALFTPTDSCSIDVSNPFKAPFLSQ